MFKWMDQLADWLVFVAFDWLAWRIGELPAIIIFWGLLVSAGAVGTVLIVAVAIGLLRVIESP
jgi:hypothetical protein